ncbi:hypothetical protein FJQ98_09030 [Lysinibacillus agricola]|uniref:Peptidase M10 metallopeptidase domain-containing protein n=1 Tax=Lysinibacillus agricola TaxID=2590012 RepID=A0ABX7AWL0_9BACI|nr:MULTISPECIES: hypothetical protein [Lysinibacillus]QQP14140.1 hypothetical protein FJQ98_09030 [Lysinibacillus agricola]
MNNYRMEYSGVVSNAVHEIGHSLKLVHPGQGTQSKTSVPSGKKAVSIGPQS